MPELLREGGVFMWLIVLCSVVAVAVFLERLFHLHRAHIHAEDFMPYQKKTFVTPAFPGYISLCSR